MIRSTRSAFLPLVALTASVVLAACGGATEGPGEPSSPPASTTPTPTATPSPGPTTEPSGPPLPLGPFTNRVDTTDVSILYPLVGAERSVNRLRASDGGSLGPLLPRAAFEKVVGRTSLDFAAPAGYDDLALVGVRLDPCPQRIACMAEIRAVFQGLSRGSKGESVAADGGVHVLYRLPDAELFDALREILTAKRANGDVGDSTLGPHPILVAQGVDGDFGARLRAIVLRHVGEARIHRITAFDHNFHLDGDGWTFTFVDKKGQDYVPGTVVGTTTESQTVGGSSAFEPLAESSAFTLPGPSTKDPVEPLVTGQRPAVGSPEAASLLPAFEAALRVENPDMHDAESTDCANCHLAEGAHRVGASMYGFTAKSLFAAGNVVPRIDQRTSVTNLHAFGYLGQQVSVTQRTANESFAIAAAMQRRLAP